MVGECVCAFCAVAYWKNKLEKCKGQNKQLKQSFREAQLENKHIRTRCRNALVSFCTLALERSPPLVGKANPSIETITSHTSTFLEDEI